MAPLAATQDQSSAVVTYARGESDERPWGRWEVIDCGPGFVVKRITVKPGAILSLQLHHHRSEHWVIASGRARVVCGEQDFIAEANTHIFIPVETQHRIANAGDGDMVFIEVQTGDRLDENDTVPLEDSYGRS